MGALSNASFQCISPGLLMLASKKTCQSNKQEAKPLKMKRSHRQIIVVVSKTNNFSGRMWNKTLCVGCAGHLFNVSAHHLSLHLKKETCQSNKKVAKPIQMKRSQHQIIVAGSKINKLSESM